jgi:hypothetical protein
VSTLHLETARAPPGQPRTMLSTKPPSIERSSTGPKACSADLCRRSSSKAISASTRDRDQPLAGSRGQPVHPQQGQTSTPRPALAVASCRECSATLVSSQEFAEAEESEGESAINAG